MKKFKLLAFVLSIIFTVLSSLNSVFAEEIGRITDKLGTEWTMFGSFEKPRIIGSGQVIFSHCGSNKTYPGYMCTQYKFIGQAGDKTFEVEYRNSSSIGKGRDDKETLKLYFSENKLFNLMYFPIYQSCKPDDKIYVKMIKLQEGELEYQIILPDCVPK